MLCPMFFSKTFGYALRSILYLSATEDPKRVQLDEVADRLNVPRHFLAKVMKKLASEGIIDSRKGPSGGFSCNESTGSTSLLTLSNVTGESLHFDNCVLKLRKCNAKKPCPLHHQALDIRNQWMHILSTTTVSDLLHDRTPDLIRGLAID